MSLIFTAKEQRLIDRAIALIESKYVQLGEPFTEPKTVGRLAQLHIGSEVSERFGVMYLNSQHQLITKEIAFIGTTNASCVHPREIVRRALELNALSVILYHNHPSGLLEASSADRTITTRIQQALELVNIQVLDHFIVSKSGFINFASLGFL